MNIQFIFWILWTITECSCKNVTRPVLLGHSPSLLTRTFLTHSLCPWNVFTQKLQCTKNNSLNKTLGSRILWLTSSKPGSYSFSRVTNMHSQGGIEYSGNLPKEKKKNSPIISVLVKYLYEVFIQSQTHHILRNLVY